jgi:hypothetical protein
MRAQQPCPGWEYDTIPNHQQILAARTQPVLATLRTDTQAVLVRRAKRTRPLHAIYFLDLTPSGYGYYAGHYRGENFRCLREYRVTVGNDPRVGFPPRVVPARMQRFVDDIDFSVEVCDIVNSQNQTAFTEPQKLLRTVKVVVSLFVYMLTIHPYANGNSHMGRFVLMAILARYGIFLARWPLNPRPPDPPYSDAIRAYRSGNEDALIRFVMQCI